MTMRYCSGCRRDTLQEIDPHSRVMLGDYVWVDLRCRICGLAEPILEEIPVIPLAAEEESSLFDRAVELYRLVSDPEVSNGQLRSRGLELAYLLIAAAARQEGRTEEMKRRLPGARLAHLLVRQGA